MTSRTNAPVLTNASPTGLAAALRSRMAAEGFAVAVGATRPQLWSDGNPAYAGQVSIEVDAPGPVPAADWVRANVAASVLDAFPVLVEERINPGLGWYCSARRVFGSLRGYLAAALRENHTGYASASAHGETDQGNDWSHWHTELTPTEREGLYALKRDWDIGTDGSAADLLRVVRAACS